MGQAIDAMHELAHRQGAFRRRDLERLGLSHAWVEHLGWVARQLGPQLWTVIGAEPPQEVQACVRIPKGILCLTSALFVHGVVEPPAEVWMAIGRKAHRSNAQHPPLRFIRCSPRLLPVDVEQRRVGRYAVPVYGLQRTLIDCVRHRRLLNEALVRSVWRQQLGSKTVSPDGLMALAKERRLYAPVRRWLSSL